MSKPTRKARAYANGAIIHLADAIKIISRDSLPYPTDFKAAQQCIHKALEFTQRAAFDDKS